MKFSVCIPNFNYQQYVGKTVQSVVDQTHTDWEVLVSDNASTDDSVKVVRAINDSRIQLRINACNVGFAGNLDRAARMATGEMMIMLSSDDMMRADALSAYQQLATSMGDKAKSSLFCSSCDLVDANDQIIGHWRLPQNNIWRESDRVAELETILSAPVYRVPAKELLRRCVTTMTNPFYFCATAYPRSLYERVEGYGGNRLFSPDKWFHWRMLGVADEAYFVDRCLFGYRWHDSNQNALQTSAGILKEQVDEYLSTFELDGKFLERAGVLREEVISAFAEHSIGRRGLASIGKGNRVRAKQILTFGRAVYPAQVGRNKKVWALRGLLAAGPLGTWLARRLYARYRTTLND